ncbi:hypothetical protein V6N11_063803 [Hibiscus sabdariffa]|uniref:Uncharacterized protein n=1 Tax=Hibiscus sabdariffa TaxID=183260 RepID=A0ABR2PM27_9ROSI
MFLLVTNQPQQHFLELIFVVLAWAFAILEAVRELQILELLCLQTVMAMINLEIGASGVVSQECKAVQQHFLELIFVVLAWAFAILEAVRELQILELLCLQTVMAMINLEIGASGVVSQECKAVQQHFLELIFVVLAWAFAILEAVRELQILELLCLQTVMAMINLEIGASGVVSQECKAVLCDRMPSPMGESAVDYKSLSSMPKVSFDKVLELALEEVVEVLKFSASAALLLWIR